MTASKNHNHQARVRMKHTCAQVSVCRIKGQVRLGPGDIIGKDLNCRGPTISPLSAFMMEINCVVGQYMQVCIVLMVSL